MRAHVPSTVLFLSVVTTLSGCDGPAVHEPGSEPAPGEAAPRPQADDPVAAREDLAPVEVAPVDTTPKVPWTNGVEPADPGLPGVTAEPAPAPIVHTPDGPDRVRVLVRFAPDADRAAAYTFITGAGARVAYRYRLVPDLVAVRELPAGAVEALARAPGVMAVLPDQIRHVNLAQSRALMNATPAQLAGLSDGAGVRVCVLDTGLNKGHPAFAGAVVAERDFVNNDMNAQDDEGHGTNVAGIIASRDGTYGGVAPGASLIVGKVLGADGSGSDSGIIAALEWCTLDVAADVVNMSLGGGKYFGTCDFDALGEAVNASVDAGVVNVIAAGNEGYTNATGSPGCARRAITVAAVYDAPAANVSWCLNASCSQYCTDTGIVADKRVCFSNQALKVDVAAPGSEITAPDGLSSGFSGQSGTSQATPHVAGLVARLLGERPELGPNDVRALLAKNAVDRGAAGYDVGFGHGRVDALATLSDETAVTCATHAACADASPCTADVCQGGFCAHRPACDDGTAATTDTCDAGACTYTPVTADDGRACTTDTLDACLGPRYTTSGGSCHATCATAVPLPIGVTVSGTTVGATKNVNLACPGYAMPGADVMYRMWLTPSQPVTLTLTPTSSWDPAIYLLAGTSASACDTTKCVGGMDVGFTSASETMVRVRVPVAGWYFVVVDGYSSGATGAFTLTTAAACDPEDAGRPCDDGNACTSNDTCVGSVCQGGVAPPECVVAGDCDDGDACNGAETCVAGDCHDGTAPSCDDGNVCTTDGCAPASGCTHAPVTDGTGCPDATVCNGDETCLAGACTAGVALVCDDANPCTTEGCHAALGCQSAAVADGTACDDGDACNGVATCQGGGCVAGAAPSCDDGDACTTDGCAPATGCTHAPVSCDDGDPCNGLEACAAGGCAAGTPLVCDDGNDCTADTCVPGAGCVYTPVANGSACADDGDVCDGAESCVAGACVSGGPLACADGNPCTADACDPVLGCVYPAVADGTGCGDGDPCNGDETCLAGACAAGAPTVCDDGNDCTADTCAPGAGCVYTPVANGSACADDGDVCDGAESCVAGACVSGGPLACADGNPCTADACDPVLGCVYPAVADGTGCGDGDLCNGDETCLAGSCAAGAPLVCDDGNACTADGCHAATGCTSAPVANGTGCDDGDACTGDDTCQAGACTGGPSTCAVPVILFTVGASSLTLPGGVAVNDEDIVRYDLTTGTYSLYFDGSDVGLSTGLANVAFDTSGNLVLSFRSSVSLGGTTIATHDLVRFTATSLGSTTAGTFSVLFDGSDVGLSQSAEALDAVAILADGSIIISTSGSVSAGGVSGAAQDLLRFVPSSLGTTTAGAWSMYFDGSDVGLSQSAENVDAVSVLADGSLLLSTTGNVSVTGASGANEDVLRFVPTTLGGTTAGSFSVYWNASSDGLSDDLEAVERRELAP